jgi:hypothetical protein
VSHLTEKSFDVTNEPFSEGRFRTFRLSKALAPIFEDVLAEAVAQVKGEFRGGKPYSNNYDLAIERAAFAIREALDIRYK